MREALARARAEAGLVLPSLVPLVTEIVDDPSSEDGPTVADDAAIRTLPRADGISSPDVSTPGAMARRASPSKDFATGTVVPTTTDGQKAARRHRSRAWMIFGASTFVGMTGVLALSWFVTRQDEAPARSAAERSAAATARAPTVEVVATPAPTATPAPPVVTSARSEPSTSPLESAAPVTKATAKRPAPPPKSTGSRPKGDDGDPLKSYGKPRR